MNAAKATDIAATFIEATSTHWLFGTSDPDERPAVRWRMQPILHHPNKPHCLVLIADLWEVTGPDEMFGEAYEFATLNATLDMSDGLPDGKHEALQAIKERRHNVMDKMVKEGFERFPPDRFRHTCESLQEERDRLARYAKLREETK